MPADRLDSSVTRPFVNSQIVCVCVICHSPRAIGGDQSCRIMQLTPSGRFGAERAMQQHLNDSVCGRTCAVCGKVFGSDREQ